MQLTALTFNWNLLKCVPVPFRLKFALCCFVSFRFDSFVSFCWLLQRIGPAECTETWLRDPLASFQIRHDQASRSAINALIFPADFLYYLSNGHEHLALALSLGFGFNFGFNVGFVCG